MASGLPLGLAAREAAAAVAPPKAGPGIPLDAISPVPNAGPIEVLTTFRSVRPGEILGLCVSDNEAPAGTTRSATWVIEQMAPAIRTMTQGTVQVQRMPVATAQAWETGVDWAAAVELPIPLDWPSGIYRARFTSASGKSASSTFVIRSASPGSLSSIAVIVPFDTNQAYNNWGGKSLYEFNSSDGIKAQRVSRRRPLAYGKGDDIVWWAVPLGRWARKAGIELEYVSGDDLHMEPGILDPYRLGVLVGHDEYWTIGMRGTLDRFMRRGGNLAVFSGNTMWWRTEFEHDVYGNRGGVLVCEKDPGTGTSNWFRYRSEAVLLGSAFSSGGNTSPSRTDLIAQAVYRVNQPAHWIFDGTGLKAGDTFGADTHPIRYEVDGVDYVLDANGMAHATGSGETPAGLQILAFYPLPDGWVRNSPCANAAITTFTIPGGGTVVNTGTTDWTRAIEPYVSRNVWAIESQITKNILLALR